MNIHSTCVQINGKGILILGIPGAGKTSLALQLMDRGARLVADDQIFLTLSADNTLIATSPPAIEGMMEIRGVGLCSFPSLKNTTIKLCVEICEDE